MSITYKIWIRNLENVFDILSIFWYNQTNVSVFKLSLFLLMWKNTTYFNLNKLVYTGLKIKHINHLWTAKDRQRPLQKPTSTPKDKAHTLSDPWGTSTPTLGTAGSHSHVDSSL